MTNPTLDPQKVRYKIFRNNSYHYSQTFIFVKKNDKWFVMAKSVVRGVIETDYPYNKDPYIKRIIEILPDSIAYFDIKNIGIIRRVWDPPKGKFGAVVFVATEDLMASLPETFSDLSSETHADIGIQISVMLGELK